MTALLRPLLGIAALWGSRVSWLLAGVVVSVLAVLSAALLMMLAGRTVAVAMMLGVLAAPMLLRWTGVARVVLRYLERVVTHDAMFRALADLRVWFFRGVARNAAGGLGFRRAGDVLSRLVNDVEALDGLYLRIVVPVAGAVVLLPVLLYALGRLDVVLAAVVGVLFVLAAFVLPVISARNAAGQGARLTTSMSRLRIATLDTLTGLREVRACGAEDRMLADIQARQALLLTAQREGAARAAWASAASFLFGQAGVAAVLFAVALNVVTTGPAALIGCAFLTIAAFEAIGGLPRAGVLAGHASAAAERVLEAASGPESNVPHAVAEAEEMLRPGRGKTAALSFRHVSFRWRQDGPLVLDDLTLDLPAGARVALLGPSGAGKSTIAALAMRLAVPEAGHIFLSGTDMATLPVDMVRGHFAWLSQTTHLFDDTIRANLLLGRPDAQEVDLWAALDAAQLGDVVRGLPDGLESWVGEGGFRLSGGQGRRLALARALLSRAPILILDEPAAGLDAQTERELFLTLNEVAGDRTVLLIAHRLTGVEKLDRIYRLSGGQAVPAMS
ncbi:ABC transporter ATP-binding protein [Granulibacter bethesdensis]|uniref:ABC transporter ATP-binding protein n=1 Tax=Granulibacter bethesdensis TaxID=364410 RepID=A0AAC9K757_9PROT|nr:thiol reductant ABC exporter subunit CydC [Granulibacter bethesdensis]APH54130.1 ABC transporter ATP-binding protein [Granulibacter bethesdensis]APH61712.1 ABC transporter ATP-binding protein [Granulibacter bethesdensis]